MSLSWCLLIAVLLVWTNRAEDRHTFDLARLQARTLYAQIVDTRAWNSAHGGVYVPESSRSPANRWLPESEQGVQADGLRLVKVNPAYMTRQISEIAVAATGGDATASFRISSPRPVRPGNFSDPWELQALQSLAADQATDEVFALTGDMERWEGRGGALFRYMAPLYVSKSCLSCHDDAREGEIRGGISVSINAGPVLAAATEHKRANITAFLVLGIAGVSGIGGATWQISRKRMQAEEANRAKTAFLAHISHDMRTPLAGIQGMLKRLERDCPGNRETVRHVRASATSLLGTVQDIMDHALREEMGEPEHLRPFSPRSCINACLDAVRPACLDKGLKLECRIASQLPEQLVGDAYHVRQIIGNLLGNAVKFTESGEVSIIVDGTVHSSPYVRDRSFFRVTSWCSLTVDVRDTGRGVAAGDEDRIFERFARYAEAGGAPAGKGLGLTIARRLARGMGGDVIVPANSGGNGEAGLWNGYFRFTACLPVAVRTDDEERDQSSCGRFLTRMGHSSESDARVAARSGLHGRDLGVGADKNAVSPAVPAALHHAALFDRCAALERLDGQENLLRELCVILDEEIASRRNAVQVARESGDVCAVLEHVHALKNSAAALGCERLRLCGAALEQALRGGGQTQGLWLAWFAALAETRRVLTSCGVVVNDTASVERGVS